VINCPNCGKPNQDHYKFCLACGTKLDAAAFAGAEGPPLLVADVAPPPLVGPPPLLGPTLGPMGSGTPTEIPDDEDDPPTLTISRAEATELSRRMDSGGMPSAAPQPPATVGPPSRVPPPKPPATTSSPKAPPPPPTRASSPSAEPPPCGQCGFVNPSGFKFCGSCGASLAPAAPPPSTLPPSTLPPSAPPPAAMMAPAPAPASPPSPMTAPAPASGPTPSPPPSAAPAPAAPAPRSATPTPVRSTPLATPAAEEDLGSARTLFVGTTTAVLEPQEPEPPPSSAANRSLLGAVLEPPRPHAPAPSGPARLVMLGPDGQPVGERVLAGGEAIDVGREAGPPWADDAYLDLTHARLTVVADGIRVDDHDSINGIFLKLNKRMEIRHGDQFRVGQELLLYEDLPEPTPTADGTERMGSPNPGYWGRISVLVDPDSASAAFPIENDGISVGREIGDITFAQDGYVSGKHCRISGDESGVYIEDLGSSNGTYMRVRTAQIVPFSSLVLIGQKLFQIERG